MKYDRAKILFKQLPTPVVIKNYVEGHPADNEEYLKEFVNASKLVQDKGNEPFCLRKHFEQSKGQNDIFNSTYELDFKILVDEKYMEGKRLLSQSITEICPGVTSYGPSKRSRSQTALNTILCFRDKTVEDLQNIEIEAIGSENKVIKQLLEKLSVDKNILFFLPYDLFYENMEADLGATKFVVECIGNDIRSMLEYRKMKIDKETYISFVSGEYFILAKENNGNLIYYDRVKTSVSDLYGYLFSVESWY